MALQLRLIHCVRVADQTILQKILRLIKRMVNAQKMLLSLVNFIRVVIAQFTGQKIFFICW